jgi:hypothetical protein
LHDDTPPTLLWSAQLREAHWRCELAEERGVWFARLFRNTELAAWYQAPAPEAALKWADALAAVFSESSRQH